MDWLEFYPAVFVTALLFSALYTPLCKKLAWKLNILDVPKCEQHKLHAKATPLLGGLSMFLSFLSVIILTALGRGIQLRYFPGLTEGLKGVSLALPQFCVLVACAAAAVLLGLYDDKHSMKAWEKLIGQILIAAVTATWG